MDACAAKFTVRNVNILITAGYRIRQCSNVDEDRLQIHLQQLGSARLKADFKQHVIACSTRKCYADQVRLLGLAALVVPLMHIVFSCRLCNSSMP